ncbi:MAG: hypothetical protein OXG52_12430 [bacterium]|nr:hypothetical protein [bacterium]
MISGAPRLPPGTDGGRLLNRGGSNNVPVRFAVSEPFADPASSP